MRRPRRSTPATIVALVPLAAAVLVTVSCVQVLLGQSPLLPLPGIGQAATTLTPASPGVIAGGVIAAVLGIVLLYAGLAPGAPTVLALSDGGTGIDTGVTRRSLDTALTRTAAGVDGVEHAQVRTSRSRATATVRTDSAERDVVGQGVRHALTERLSDLAPARNPRISVKVTTARNP